MVALLAAFCTAVVFCGGGWFMFQPVPGLVTASFGIIGLGFTFAALQSGLGVFGVQISGGGITVGQLKLVLDDTTPDTLVYVASPTMKPVGSMFQCRYGDKQVLVLERMPEGEIQSTHDLF